MEMLLGSKKRALEEAMMLERSTGREEVCRFIDVDGSSKD